MFKREFWNRLWIVGRRNDHNFIRIFPNPGFSLKFGKKKIKWSKFRGLEISKKR